MRKSPEVSMEGGLTKPRGYQVTRPCAFLLACLILITIGAALLVMYLLAPCPCAAPSEFHFSKLNKKPQIYVRLPTSVKPHSYTVRLIPFIYPGNFTFGGYVEIVCNVTQPTHNITLHSADLRIHKTSVRRVGSDIITDSDPNLHVPIRRTEFDEAREFYVIYMSRALSVGQYRVTITFTGVLNDALQGFYRSSYTVNNVTRWLAATQFQSTDARRAFPCFDEPALKAKFTLSIGRPANMTSISNMPKIGPPVPIEGTLNYEWDHYMESLPMSTYLIAFAISDFDHLSDGTFKVWARAGAIQQAKYALKIGPKILRYYEEFFQISYPLPKMDMIALPDFASGAMENWGLITYRESAMLYQDGVSTNRNKESVAQVLAHELAHQWFGNLVTPSWWSDLWLNEGFATYIETLGVDVVEPTWRTSDEFVVADLQNVLEQDAYKSSHPISASVSHPDEIDEIFDSISYGKGASIIRMMDHFLTNSVFKRGLTNYLRSRMYQSATQDDLWQAMTEQAHKERTLPEGFNVKEIMDTWTLKTGFPVVTVTRNYKTGSLAITQKRFEYIPSTKELSDWWVPLSFTTQEKSDFTSTRPSHWMKGKGRLDIKDLGLPAHHWILFNINETGFYRVNYDEENWNMLIDHLKSPEKYLKIGELNRAQILDDSMQLARAGLLNYTIALDLTTYLVEEVSYFPWSSAFGGFHFINTMIDRMPVYNKFKKYVLDLFNKLYDETGFTDNVYDEQLMIYKRALVIRWACTLGKGDCVRNAVTQFQNWRSSPQPDKNNPISPNLKGTVYCTALREGGQVEWDFAWERYLKSNVGSEKGLLLFALGCSRETWILSRYLHWSITEGSGIRKQDAVAVFNSVSDNVIGRSLTFNFVRENWEKIKAYIGTNVYTLNSIVRSITHDMNTEFELKTLKEFAMTKREEGLGSATQAVEQAIEVVQTNVHWMKTNYKHVENWLETTQ